MASQSFGTRLRAERESRGFTLEQIAESTKIPAALLDALERDDLSRWPKGIYRRAFFRSYVTALGVRVEPLVLEFARMFPDEAPAPAGPHECPAGDPAAAEPLTLSWAGPSATDRLLRSVVVALAEVAVIAAVGGVIAWTSRLHTFEAIGAVALVYLPGIRLAAGRTRRWKAVRRRAPATGPGVATIAAGQPASNPVLAAHPLPKIPDAVLDPRRPVAARLATATSVVSPAARRTGQLMKVSGVVTAGMTMRGMKRAGTFLARTSIAARRRWSVAAQETRRVSSRAFAFTTLAFWKWVRAAAEHAELLATRQLNRSQD